MTRKVGTALTAIKWSGVASLLVQPDPQFWVTAGVFITGIIQVIMFVLNSRREDKRRLWEREDRAAHRRELHEQVRQVKADVAENTAITKEAKSLNLTALDAANHVNEKLARIAEGTMAKQISDTNETAHRIEEKL